MIKGVKKTLSQTVSIKKPTPMDQYTQRSANTITKLKTPKKEELLSVTPFRKYTGESKVERESLNKVTSSSNIRAKTTKLTNKINTDKIIEDELQRLVSVNINTLVSTINEKVKNEYEIYNKKINEFISSLYNDKIRKIEEIANSYEGDIRRLEPILDACMYIRLI